MSDPNAEAPRGLLNWWQGLILAASSAIVGVVAAVYIMKGGPGDVSGTGPSWAMLLLRFVPHFLLLFGILADAFTFEGVYWTGTMVGVISVFIAPLLDKASAGFVAVLSKLFEKKPISPTGGMLASLARLKGGGEYLGCSLMSEGNEGTGGVPQTLTVTASIIAYYIFDLVFNLSLLDASGAIVAGLVLFGGQAMAISGCLDEGKITMAAVFAGIYGIIIGGAGYTAINSFAPKYLPSSILAGSITSGGGGQPGAPGARGGPGRQGLGMSGPGAPGDPNSPPPLAVGSGMPGAKAVCPS
jgi:hypothetical protein